MPAEFLQQINGRFRSRRLAVFAISLFAVFAIAQQAKDPVLDGWDSQFSNAPLQAQTMVARSRVQAEIDA